MTAPQLLIASVLALLAATPVFSQPDKDCRFFDGCAPARTAEGERLAEDAPWVLPRTFSRQRNGKAICCATGSPVKRRSPRARLPPVRDQGALSWCYAYAAADLLSLRLAAPVSATDLAMLHNERYLLRIVQARKEVTRWQQLLTTGVGGAAATALQEAVNRGVCLEEEIYSRIISLPRQMELETAEIITTR